MNRLIRHIVIGSALLSSTIQLNAQVIDTIPVDLPAEEVEVIKSFEARIENARKVNFNPSSVPGKAKTKFDYDVIIRPIELVYPDPVIKPVAMVPDQNPEKSNGFLKLGYGSLNTIHGLLPMIIYQIKRLKLTLKADIYTLTTKKNLFKNIKILTERQA